MNKALIDEFSIEVATTVMNPSFFLTNNIGAPHDDVLGRTKPLSNKSCNYTFNSFSSVGAIRYEGIDTGSVPG